MMAITLKLGIFMKVQRIYINKAVNKIPTVWLKFQHEILGDLLDLFMYQFSYQYLFLECCEGKNELKY